MSLLKHFTMFILYSWTGIIFKRIVHDSDQKEPSHSSNDVEFLQAE